MKPRKSVFTTIHKVFSVLALVSNFFSQITNKIKLPINNENSEYQNIEA